MKTCILQGCDRPHWKFGYCKKCFWGLPLEWQLHIRERAKLESAVERLEEEVENQLRVRLEEVMEEGV